MSKSRRSSGPASDSAAQERFPFQAELEERFGQDFSDLTVEFGSMGALAAAAEPETLRLPTGSIDLETVAHELAHVVQFRLHGPGDAEVGDADGSAEVEADDVAEQASRGADVDPKSAPDGQEQHKKKHHRAHVEYAKQDDYNDADVRNNHPEGQVERQRPGVTLGKGRKRDDTFQIGANGAPMYFGNGELRTQLGGGSEVCVNPAAPRRFGTETCVLAWCGEKGSGWVPASAIFDGDDAVGSTLVSKLRGSTYQDWRPEDDDFRNAHHKMRFKSSVEGPSEHDSAGMPAKTAEYVFPNQTRANHTRDHLLRTGGNTRPEDDYYNVFMDLPQRDAAAVAHDVAQPGEWFWVVKNGEHLMKRTVDTFHEGNTKHGRDLTFVYGYVGSEDGPDKRRRGWVAYPVLE